MTERKKKTIIDLQQMKRDNQKAVWVVVYDACMAAYAEQSGMDMLLVGDSLGMILYGYKGTVPVTMDMSILHCQAVRRGAPNTYIIGDMPFGSYQSSPEAAVDNAVRFLKEADVDAIKLEGGVSVKDSIRAIANAGIVVFGHIGLTPQSSAAMGGFTMQGGSAESARAIIEDGLAVYESGAKALLLEAVPEPITAFLAKKLPIPVYGIAAGADCDGQVQVCSDILGMFDAPLLKYTRKYMNMKQGVVKAFTSYVNDVRKGGFPVGGEVHEFSGDLAALQKLFDEYK